MDNAQEYISLRNHIRREGIPTRCHFSMAYSPSQNGIAERRIGLIVLKMRSLLLEGDLPKILWGEAALYAVWLINITPCYEHPDSFADGLQALGTSLDVHGGS
jgi:hypothetical protein